MMDQSDGLENEPKNGASKNAYPVDSRYKNTAGFTGRDVFLNGL